MKKLTSIALLVFVAASLLAETPQENGISVLSEKSKWRKYYTFFPPRISEKAAKELNIDPGDVKARVECLPKATGSQVLEYETAPPPEQWMTTEFDDSGWIRVAGRDLTRGDGRARGTPDYLQGTDPFIPGVGLINMRGKFLVKDTDKIEKLTFRFKYRGGFVAYLNGKEFARQKLPQGNMDYRTTAEEYPVEAFLAKKKDGAFGGPLHWYTHGKEEYMPQWKLRQRTYGPIEIDKALVKKGLNVLAIECHRTDYPAVSTKKSGRGQIGFCFATVGIAEVSLRADTPADNIVSATRRTQGLQVWNAEPWESVHGSDTGNGAEELKPVRINGAKNGLFRGQLIIGSSQEVTGLTVTPSDLTGPGTIPAGDIEVKYAFPNPTQRDTRFDMLLDVPPESAQVVPVWFFVKVAKSAKPGTYKGAVTVKADGSDPVTAEISLTVADWTLPDVADYTSVTFIYESPETLLYSYKADRWSDKHWGLIEKSLALMGEAGNIALVFPLVAETSHGNPYSWITWIKKDDGTYDCDLSVFDRYLETAMKYHDPARIKVIGFFVWGLELSNRRAKDEYFEKAQVTVRDPKTGKLSNILTPKYGTKECEEFWRPVILKLRDRVKKVGLDDKIMFGIMSDVSPQPSHVKMFNNILPGTLWMKEGHIDTRWVRSDPDDKTKRIGVGSNSVLWGGQPSSVPWTGSKRWFGWKCDPKHLVYSYRCGLKGFPPPSKFYVWQERCLAINRIGLGRVGGDFFKIGMGVARERWGGTRMRSEAFGGCSGTLFNSYPRSNVGQVGIGNTTTDFFAPAADGPVTTVRFECYKESIQPAEAKIFIERALESETLPEEFAKQCRTLLDHRVNTLRVNRMSNFTIGYHDWHESTRQLYEYAARIQKTSKE
jgi:hypothetical protein